MPAAGRAGASDPHFPRRRVGEKLDILPRLTQVIEHSHSALGKDRTLLDGGVAVLNIGRVSSFSPTLRRGRCRIGSAALLAASFVSAVVDRLSQRTLCFIS